MTAFEAWYLYMAVGAFAAFGVVLAWTDWYSHRS